ncbi:MAG: hypothetical protein ABI882_18605 [Acidobacteriota bacterium]
MNKKKTEALTFPTNPLAAMRELQDLDPAPPSEAERDEEESSVEVEPEEAPRSYRQFEGPSPRAADPVRQAIIQVLSQPLPADTLKGPFTVTTVKVPTVIWERLALFAQLTGEHKQEIFAKALKEFLKPGRAKSGV